MIMSTSLVVSTEARWLTYLKGGIFILPALLFWTFAHIFIFPKLQQIWRDAGFEAPTIQSIVRASNSFSEHGPLICAAVILVLILLEWRNRTWPRYRRVSVGTVAFLLNSAVLFVLTTMLASALLAAPALMQLK